MKYVKQYGKNVSTSNMEMCMASVYVMFRWAGRSEDFYFTRNNFPTFLLVHTYTYVG